MNRNPANVFDLTLALFWFRFDTNIGGAPVIWQVVVKKASDPLRNRALCRASASH